MRHQISKPRLNRPVGHRRLVLKNLLSQLYSRGAIVTTQAKAKAVQPLAERLITLAKPQTVAARRHLAALLTDQLTVKKLVDQIVPAYDTVTSGFTRLIKVGYRRGDNALMVRLELTKQPVALEIKPGSTVKPKVAKKAKTATKKA